MDEQQKQQGEKHLGQLVNQSVQHGRPSKKEVVGWSVFYVVLMSSIQVVASRMWVAFIIMKHSVTINPTTDKVNHELLMEEVNRSVVKYGPVIIALAGILSLFVLGAIYESRKKSIKQVFAFFKPCSGGFLVSVGGAVGLVLVVASLLYLIYSYLPLKNYMTLNRPFSINNSYLGISLFIFVIVTPIYEELIFRGAIYYELTQALTVKWKIILQAFLFGVIHFNIIQTPYAFIFGIFLGLLRYWFDSIYWPILAHVTINGVTILFTLLMNKIEVSSQGLYYMIAGVVGLGVLVGAILKGQLRHKERKQENEFIGI